MRSGRGSRVTRGPCSDAKNNCMLVRAYTSKSHVVKIQFLSKKSPVQQMSPSQKTPAGHNAEITGLWEMQLPWINMVFIIRTPTSMA